MKRPAALPAGPHCAAGNAHARIYGMDPGPRTPSDLYGRWPLLRPGSSVGRELGPAAVAMAVGGRSDGDPDYHLTPSDPGIGYLFIAGRRILPGFPHGSGAPASGLGAPPPPPPPPPPCRSDSPDSAVLRLSGWSNPMNPKWLSRLLQSSRDAGAPEVTAEAYLQALRTMKPRARSVTDPPEWSPPRGQSPASSVSIPDPGSSNAGTSDPGNETPTGTGQQAGLIPGQRCGCGTAAIRR